MRFVSFSLSVTRNDCVNVPFSMLAHCVQANSDAINKSVKYYLSIVKYLHHLQYIYGDLNSLDLRI